YGEEESKNCVAHDNVHHNSSRDRLSAGDHGTGADLVSKPGKWAIDSARWQDHRVSPYRTSLLRNPLFPFTAIGGGQWLRRSEFRRHQFGTDESKAHRARRA